MIILVYGLPGTGKSFFSRRLAKDIDAHYLHADSIQEEFGSKQSYIARFKQSAYNRLIEEVRDKLEKGRIIIVDGAFQRKIIRRKLFKVARETGHRVCIIEIKANDQTVRERMRTMDEYREADYKVYRKIKCEFEFYQEDHLELWSDMETLETMLIKTRDFIFRE